MSKFKIGTHYPFEVTKNTKQATSCAYDAPKVAVIYLQIIPAYMSAAELRAAAAVLLELAGALE